MNSIIPLFPLPYILDGKKIDGSMLRWPSECHKCKTCICETVPKDKEGICSYGFNYQVIGNGLVVGGIVLRDYPTLTPARKKKLKTYKSVLISRQHLENVIKMYGEFSSAELMDIEKRKKSIIDQYVEEKQYELDFLQKLRPDIVKGLSFLHDYKQINAQIIQNINVLIETDFEAASFEEKVDKSTPQHKAIYKASKLLEEKLNVAKILMNPEWINDKKEFKLCRFHGLVLKYCRIYASHFELKNITVEITGQSHAEIFAHPEAVAVIPHTFIDNALKYAPKSSTVCIHVQDSHDQIEFSVSSYGPQILDEERDKIFQAFYRGQAAKKQEEEGAGYGLYVSQLVATIHLGTKIQLIQEPKKKGQPAYWTVFSIIIPINTNA